MQYSSKICYRISFEFLPIQDTKGTKHSRCELSYKVKESIVENHEMGEIRFYISLPSYNSHNTHELGMVTPDICS